MAPFLGEQKRFCWRLCRVCGCRFVDRYPTQDELEGNYRSYYGRGNLEITPFIQKRLEEVVATFASFRQGGKLLDIGFGAGGLLSAAESAGWDCWGTEVAPQALAFGRKRGWEVLEGDFLSLTVPEDTFDVVCMVEVLEHLEQPAAYLHRAWKVLRPGGVLWLTTPNGSSVNSRILRTSWSVFDAPDHLQLFTASALQRLLQRADFRQVTIRTEGFNPAELRNHLFGRKEVCVDRVSTGIALNERLSKRGTARLVKTIANSLLNVTKLGDTLKAMARKPRYGGVDPQAKGKDRPICCH